MSNSTYIEEEGCMALPEKKKKVYAKEEGVKYAPGDIVTVTNEITLTSRHEGIDKELEVQGRDATVVIPFIDFDGTEAVLLDFGGFTSPFMCKDIELKQAAPIKEADHQTPEPYEVLKSFVNDMPAFSLGYVYKVNRRLVAAHSLEEAIGIFRAQHGTETIESINLIERDNALIQNEIPLV